MTQDAVTERELLESHPFAHGLSGAELAPLVDCATRVQFEAGAVIFREGEPADTLYLIVSGRVALEQYIPGRGDVQLENLSGGDMLGLSWLFSGGRWVLDARAVEATVTLALGAACVHAALAADPALDAAVSKHVIHQLYQRLERVRLQRLDVYRGEP